MAFVFFAFAPGHYSFDAAYLWWMARHDVIDSTHPPVLALLWQAARALLPDPEGFFALQLILVGVGLALTSSALSVPRWAQAAVVLGFVAWPAFGALLPQVWKDVWMVGALLVAVGSLLHNDRSPRSGWRALALFALVLAASSRFNAISGVLPLLIWLLIADRQARPQAGAGCVLVRAVGLVTLFAVLVLAPAKFSADRDVPAWPYVALWDLVAVGMETGDLAIPSTLLADGATPEAFERFFRPDTNTTTVGSGLTLYYEERPLTAEESDGLLRAWVSLPFQHPAAWAAHRWRLTTHLFGGAVGRDPGLVLMPGIVPFQDNPPLLPSNPDLSRPLDAFWRTLSGTAIFEGRWYLLGVAIALFVALRARRWPAVAVAASALGMVLPLLLVAPSAEFRYLLWLVAATPLSLLLLIRPQPMTHRSPT
jgi:hypothetical protein